MIRIGHRGAAGHLPENTLASFRLAIELGVDLIECDIQACGSGELVIIHDRTIKRTTDGHGFVKNLTLDRLRSFNAGSGEKIPLLAELLDLAGNRIPLNLEIKAKGITARLFELTSSLIERRIGGLPAVLVSSFDHRELIELRKRSDRIAIGVLDERLGSKTLVVAGRLGAEAICLGRAGIDDRVVSVVHEAGCRLFVYTVNDSIEAAALAKLGVDGLFSDFPDLIKIDG